MEDYIRNGHDEEVGKNLALRWIQQKLQLNGFDMETNFGLPAPNFALISELFEAEVGILNENLRSDARRLGKGLKDQLNVDQRAIFDEIITCTNNIDSNVPRLFFLDGPGGTGKTFLFYTIINELEGQGKK